MLFRSGTDREGATTNTDSEGGDDLVTPTVIPEPPRAAVIGTSAAATIKLPSSTVDGARPCDTDGDGQADATCRLLIGYECKSVEQQREGFVATDLDAYQRTLVERFANPKQIKKTPEPPVAEARG